MLLVQEKKHPIAGMLSSTDQVMMILVYCYSFFLLRCKSCQLICTIKQHGIYTPMINFSQIPYSFQLAHPCFLELSNGGFRLKIGPLLSEIQPFLCNIPIHFTKMTTTQPKISRFSIRNHRWKAEKKLYHCISAQCAN